MAQFPEIDKLVTAMILDVGLRKATAYRSPTFTVKLSRQRRHGGRSKAETMLLTYGVPNYAERRFIEKHRASGAPFPIEKVQLKYWPAKKKVKR